MKINSELPKNVDSWPPGVLDDLVVFRQGDVVPRCPLFYFGDPGRPVLTRTAAYADGGEGPEVIIVEDDDLPPYGMVTTQSCDVSEEGRAQAVRPWVQLAPVFDGTTTLDKGYQRKLLAGRGPRYWLRIPGLDGLFYADLRIELPVEKGWLASQARTAGFPDVADQLSLAQRLSWLRDRAAFPEQVRDRVELTLHEELVRLRDELPDAFAAAEEEVEEFGFLLDDFESPSQVQVAVLHLGSLSPEVWTALQEWNDWAVVKCADVGFALLPNDYQSLDELSARDYRHMLVAPFGAVAY